MSVGLIRLSRGIGHLRILMFCQLFHPLIYGGGEVVFWNLARTLASRGHAVYVITQKIRGEESREIASGVNIVRVGRPVEYTGALTTSFIDSLVYLVSSCLTGIRLAVHQRVNVIHSNTYVPALAAQICASIIRKPHVMTVHDVYLLSIPLFWERWSEQSDVSFLARSFGPAIEQLLVRMPVTIIHTVSETSRRDLLRVTSKNRRIVAVPNGIRTEDYNPRFKCVNSPHQAVFICRLVFYKNLEVVFQAFRRVIREVPDAQLVIVGDGPMKSVWTAIVKELGLSQHFRFLGRISNEQKLRLLTESAFLLLPSKTEGFGIVILEAFACHKTVIVSSIGALQEVVTDGLDGYLVDPDDADDWSEKMLQLFQDGQLAEGMGAKGYEKLLQTYGIERVAAKMESLYRTGLE
jgi:glycosyltransferase involved in cell wall biosynthesis